MSEGRNWHSYDCVIRIKGVSARPIPFSQMTRKDGEVLNIEEILAGPCIEVTEEERLHQEKLDFIMADIIDWAIDQLSWTNAHAVRSIYFESKTVKQYSEEECVTIFAVYKRLERSYPMLREIIVEEVDGLDPVTRAEIVAKFGIGGVDE